MLDDPSRRLGGPAGAPVDPASSRRLVLGFAVVSGGIYLALALLGDLRDAPWALYPATGLLLALMFATWWRCRGSRRFREIVLAGAVVFRLIAALGAPALSDDVYRYVWDGRVSSHGISPYRYAPADPALAELRGEGWERINHPELKTIYPPLAQLFFLALAAVGAGPVGFKLATAALDVGVVLALSTLLRRARLPGDRLILYAWNPLAILEAAGSGHVEPLGVAPVVLAAAWIIDRRPGRCTSALAAAVQAKLLPLVLLPIYLRRLGPRQWIPLLLSLLLLVPFVWPDPAGNGGLSAYAERWERNAPIFPLVREGLEAVDAGNVLKGGVAELQRRVGGEPGWIPWELLYRHVWPPYVARWIVALFGVAWLLWLARGPVRPIARECLLALGGVLLLSPTLHPWYLLWLLPFAAATLSWPWLLLAALIPLGYRGGVADVPWTIRLVEYLPPLAVAAWRAAPWRARRGAATMGP